VAVAALLIAVAIVVRGTLDDDESADSDAPADDDDLVVACVRELREACEALGGDVRIEDPAATIAAAGEIDAWVTFDPWPEIVGVQTGAPVFDESPVPVATSDLVLVTRTAALPDACGPEPDWVCVAASTNAPALPPEDTALGALLLGHAALGWNLVERDGQSFARQEAESPEFDAWLQTLELDGDPLDDMLQIGRAGPVATGTTRATFETVVPTTREAANLDATRTAVPASVAVVVVGPSADRVAGDEALLDGLEALGWVLDPEAATTGLPNAGVLCALQEIA
jgi:hypothetical protein